MSFSELNLRDIPCSRRFFKVISTVTANLLDMAYLIFLFLMSPFLVLLIRRKSLWTKQNILSWLGLAKTPEMVSPVLFHAVSFGEFRNISFIVERLNKPCVVLTPDQELLEYLMKNWVNRERAVMLAPLDFSFAVRRILRKIHPALIVISEVDAWPNFLSEAAGSGVPLYFVNVRLSPGNSILFRLFPLYRMLLNRAGVYAKDQKNRALLKKSGIACRGVVNFKLLSKT
ncbi:MAG: glycosyltransferase N-terminal domain-containing protein, partial [Candidatus Wallbacteria bacterium]|nr:glycosyltransferase N-terminal domain-containing protein [Candidatus Wallbacteria bacterium]